MQKMQLKNLFILKQFGKQNEHNLQPNVLSKKHTEDRVLFFLSNPADYSAGIFI